MLVRLSLVFEEHLVAGAEPEQHCPNEVLLVPLTGEVLAANVEGRVGVVLRPIHVLGVVPRSDRHIPLEIPRHISDRG